MSLEKMIGVGPRKPRIRRDNWFLVIPAAILGLVALYTIDRMYQAGDIRRSIEVVTDFRAGVDTEPTPTLGEYIESRQQSAIDCSAALVSRFYGTLDVTCAPASCPTCKQQRYSWRVHVGQRAFAPADETTRSLMAEFAPEIFGPQGNDTADGGGS